MSIKRLSSWVVLVLLASGWAVAADGRVSTRFELSQVKPLLQGIARLCSAGFTRDEAQHLAAQIAALKTEAAQTWDFTATCKGAPRQLRIRALVDELSGVDLDFATDPDFATQIRQVVSERERK